MGRITAKHESERGEDLRVIFVARPLPEEWAELAGRESELLASELAARRSLP